MRTRFLRPLVDLSLHIPVTKSLLQAASAIPDRRFAVYEELRQSRGQVFKDPVTRSTVVLGHPEVCEVLANRDTFRTDVVTLGDKVPEFAKSLLRPIVTVNDDTVLHVDDARHAQYRHAVAPPLRPAIVQQIRPMIEDLVDEVFTSRLRGARVDIVRDLAVGLPFAVVSTMFGVPTADQPRLHRAVETLARAAVHRYEPTTFARMPSIIAAGSYLSTYLDELLARPVDSFARPAPLLDSFRKAGRLSRDGAYANFVTMMIAGVETTTNLIGTTTYELLRSPDQLRRVSSGDVPLRAALQEVVRFNGPAQVLIRRAARDSEIGGIAVAEGSRVQLVLGAADRDVRVHQRPNTFDVGRYVQPSGPAPLAFGQGSHRCPGDVLAYTEVEIVLQRLLARNLRRAEGVLPEFDRSMRFSSLKALEVNLDPIVQGVTPNGASPADDFEGRALRLA